MIAPGIVVGRPSQYLHHIETIRADSDIADITFSNIPSWARHLRVIGVARGNRATQPDVLTVKINGSTSNLWHYYAELSGSGAAQTFFGDRATGGDAAYIASNGTTAEIFSSVALDIPYPNAPNRFKVVSGFSAYSETGGGNGRFLMSVVHRNLVEPIRSLGFYVSIGTLLVAGSELSLYGER